MIKKIKEQLKRFKKWIIALILGGTVFAVGIALQPDQIPFVIVNGERIEFPYTDENSNENFIIRTNKETYGGWDKAEVYAMVENKSGIGQTINFQVFFSDNKRSMTSVSKLKQAIPYQITVNDYATSTYACGYYEWANGSTTKTWIDKTCEKQEIVGIHQETKYKDEWRLRPILPFSKEEYASLISLKDIPEKDKKGFVAEKKIEDLSLKNEISYFKIEIQFPRQTQGEFFLEIVGSEAGYSHLDPWYNGSWLYRKKITIDEAKVDADLTNFPVAVILASSTNFDFTKTRGDGYDVIFTKDDGSTLIDFERERYSTTTGNAEFWVEIPSVASSTASTTFYMYYGNSGASDISSSSAPWDANFKAVWHQDEDPSVNYNLDSTQNAHNATSAGSMTSADLVSGKIGKAIDYDGTDDVLIVNDHNDFSPTGFTLEFWVETPTLTGTDGLVNKTINPTREWATMVTKNGSVDFLVFDAQVDYIGRRYNGGGVALEGQGWNFLHFIWDGGTTEAAIEIWMNGSRVDDTSYSSGVFSFVNSSVNVWLGEYYSSTYHLQGKLDEIRFSAIERSAAWMKASYNSGNNTLLTYSAEEQVPSGAVEPTMEIIIIE